MLGDRSSKSFTWSFNILELCRPAIDRAIYFSICAPSNLPCGDLQLPSHGIMSLYWLDQQLLVTAYTCFGFLFLYAIFRTLYCEYATPLRDIPGPWVAKYTRFWLCRAINSREFDKINIDLHKKHGPIVRLAPNEYSFDDPEAAQIIYRFKDQLVKVR